jgi:hypothetical protein
MAASYAVPVRQASALPAASFRFRLAADTLAVRLAVPRDGPAEDLHLQVRAPCRAHRRNGSASRRKQSRVKMTKPRPSLKKARYIAELSECKNQAKTISFSPRIHLVLKMENLLLLCSHIAA